MCRVVSSGKEQHVFTRSIFSVFVRHLFRHIGPRRSFRSRKTGLSSASYRCILFSFLGCSLYIDRYLCFLPVGVRCSGSDGSRSIPCPFSSCGFRGIYLRCRYGHELLPSAPGRFRRNPFFPSLPSPCPRPPTGGSSSKRTTPWFRFGILLCPFPRPEEQVLRREKGRCLFEKRTT